ncbi:L-ornithine aminotransferase [Grosmannia clavigera kw1407]|uniref:Ornithine aminotransferase n=1 Tax=Grosmannia clavigera (strain kw1407 / UAMH 11150) TaxID=655863 RepID=F0XAP5_GROCL|nr:L-ornithine aminotransferase [Grosmannia clavigera kw1407]EFX05899.1 L-ornithine aminotransferase [Grosmannia clavigera kw1407]
MMPPSLQIDESQDRSTNSIHGLTAKSEESVNKWLKYVVFESAEGSTITDVDGKKYIDFIAQFAVMSFGHSHPKIIKAAVDQLQKLPLVNTSYINPLYADFAERITKKFNYDSITSMCTGAEAVDGACKIARKWAYVKKGVPADKAIILTADSCYHGMTLSTMSMTDSILENFGRHLPNVGPFAPESGKLIKFGETDVLKETFEASGDVIAAFVVEPVQGSAGCRVPPEGYLKTVQDLCHKHNVLFICDEVQSGYCRTGTDMAYQQEAGVQPDLITLGKAVTGGLYPMSIIMGKSHVMDTLRKYEVGSTFAASTVACAAALAALDVMEEEQLSERSKRLGVVLTKAIDDANLPYVTLHQGRNRGLFQTLTVDESAPNVTARRIAALCALRGMLCGCSSNRLRFSPPLVISETEILKGKTSLAI